MKKSGSKYESVIGLEVHAQLLTHSKIFCGCSTQFGAEENTQVCPVCSGMPGVLPVLNRKAVECAIKMGLATNCKINAQSVFARKNYFYPDLPKGYQISQYDQPLCRNGFIEIQINNAQKKIGISRIHLEEDAGKSIHDEDWLKTDETLVDLNRCGIPLIEIVSEPDITSPHEAYAYLASLKQLLIYLEICDGNMEQGSLRCDANISVKPAGRDELGIKTEIKNLNSFHGVKDALSYEINRQTQIIMSGATVEHETLLWDATKNIASTMRTKEESHDYRYFQEPDLVPIQIDQTWIDEINAQMPELPLQRRKRFVTQYNLPEYDADVLTENRMIADYFEQVAQAVADPKLVSNWVMGEILRIIKEQKIIDKIPVSGTALAELLNLIIDGTLNEKIAKDILNEIMTTGKSVTTIIKDKNLVQISDRELLSQVISEILNSHPEEVMKYRTGKTKLFGFFVGQVMQKTQGKANPHLVNKLLLEKLSSL